MLLMSKVLKVAQIYYKGCNALYVEGVERSSKWSYTSLLITFLIFNRFSNTMYVEACQRCQRSK